MPKPHPSMTYYQSSWLISSCYIPNVCSMCSLILSHICHAARFLCCFYKYCPWFFKFAINYGSEYFFLIFQNQRTLVRAFKKSRNKIFISSECLKIFKRKVFLKEPTAQGAPNCFVQFFKK